VENAARLYGEGVRAFMRLASSIRDELKLSLCLAKASYCDFMKAYCEALGLRKSLEDVKAKGGPAGPDEVGRLKMLVRLAERCLRETVRRLEKLREVIEDEALRGEMTELIKMVGEKVEPFLDFRDEVEGLRPDMEEVRKG